MSSFSASLLKASASARKFSSKLASMQDASSIGTGDGSHGGLQGKFCRGGFLVLLLFQKSRVFLKCEMSLGELI